MFYSLRLASAGESALFQLVISSLAMSTEVTTHFKMKKKNEMKSVCESIAQHVKNKKNKKCTCVFFVIYFKQNFQVYNIIHYITHYRCHSLLFLSARHYFTFITRLCNFKQLGSNHNYLIFAPDIIISHTYLNTFKQVCNICLHFEIVLL